MPSSARSSPAISASAWREAERQGAFRGSADDRRDGFIHFSTASQVPGTVAKHFAGQDDLILAMVDLAALGHSVKWEESRGGQLFPHHYGTLPMSAITSHAKLRLGEDGLHIFPAGF